MYHIRVYQHTDVPGRPWVALGELRRSDGDHLQAFSQRREAEAMCERYNAKHGHLGLRYEVQGPGGDAV